MYYEFVIKELNKLVEEIEQLNNQKEKLNEKTKPDQVLFRKRSKDLKNELNNISKKAYEYNNELLDSIKVRNKAKDWKSLFEMKQRHSKLESKREELLTKFRDLRKKHYEGISPFMKKKRNISKETQELTVKIFERIKKK